jgi:V8-like Glu-specific endopeptidase
MSLFKTPQTRTARRLASLAAAAATIAATSLAFAAPADAAPRQLDDATANASVVGGYFPSTQWPWMAALVTPGAGSDYQRHFCGGTLVHARLVVTAAHCVVDKTTNRVKAPSQVEVVLGKRKLSAPGGEHIAVQHVQVHSSYNNPRRFSHDVALLYLASPSAQTPAALGSPSTQLYQGNVVTAMGWGLVQGNSPYGTHHADDVKAVDLGVWGDTACANSSVGSSYDPATMICAGWSDTADTICSGDSGGPLMYVDTAGTWRLIGVTSWAKTDCGGYAPSGWAWLGNASIYSMISQGIASAGRLGSSPTHSSAEPNPTPTLRLSQVGLARMVVRRGGALGIRYSASSGGRVVMQYTRRGRNIGAAWTSTARAGHNSLRLPVRNRGRALGRGAYGLTVQIAAGPVYSNPVRLTFRVR